MRSFYIVFVLYLIKTSKGSENSTDICSKEKCLPKCCPIGEYVGPKKTCKKYHDKPWNFSEVPVYREDLTKSGTSVFDSFVLDPAKFSNTTFRKSVYDFSASPVMKFNFLLKEDGLLSYELPNDYERWMIIDQNNFCIDYGSSRNSIEITARFWVHLPDSVKPPVSNWFFSRALICSCVFLVLVLVVYCLLPELRNLCGMILMAYVASLLFSFLLLAVMQMRKHSKETCQRLSFSTYFFILSSFCWMNVMSYDIWWTFRGYAKARPIHRRGEVFKFLMYCIYGFGLPLAMTIGLAVVNELDLSYWPWFIKPMIPIKACFIEGGQKLLYLYTPMMILIMCNWLFFALTTFNIWRLSRGTAVLDSAAAGTPAAHRTQMYRFLVYLKLSLVMGLSWVLEVVSFVFPNFKVWNISDLYNILIGLSIFLIFVCKKKIFKKLIKVLGGFNLHRHSPSGNSRSSSTSDSNSSQETTLPICANPRGPGYIDKMKSIYHEDSEELRMSTKKL